MGNSYYKSVWEDDRFFEQHIAEDNLFDNNNPVEIAIAIAKHKASSGNYDTYRGNDKGATGKVCYTCVRTIFDDSGLPVPKTNSVVTFIDAMRGHHVELENHPIDTFRSNNEFVKYVRKPWEHTEKWEIIRSVEDITAGDILIVESASAGSGYHAAMITETRPPAENFIERQLEKIPYINRWFSGISVVHDQGSPTTFNENVVHVDDYSWEELKSGKDGGGILGNRKFVEAYRYIGEPK